MVKCVSFTNPLSPPPCRPIKFQRCTNAACRRPYQVNEFIGRKAAFRQDRYIVCPHCGHSEPRGEESVFLAHALTPEQEAEFNQKHPR
jgi:DNA-directed RNA polymerase subunit RPC12/RpoP